MVDCWNNLHDVLGCINEFDIRIIMTLFKIIFAFALLAYCFYLRQTDGTAGFWVFPAIVAMFWIMTNFGYILYGKRGYRYRQLLLKKRKDNVKKNSTK
jgi:hypothetical protein